MRFKKLDVVNYNLNSLYNITTPLVAKTVSALEYDEKKLNFINDNYLKYVGNPFDFKMMDQATYLVKKCIINQEKILIYGDYESDGIYSTSILLKVLNNFEANFAYYIPNKFVDGRGLNANITKMIIRKGYKLVICLANELEGYEHIETLRNYGIDVIIIDRKEMMNLPNASAIINPSVTSKDISYQTTTSVLTYKFVRALVGYYDDFSLAIAGMSLVDSRINLNEENYHILKRTLYILNNKKYPFISLLNRNYHFVDIDILKEIDRRINSFSVLSHANDVNKLPLIFDTEVKEDIVTFSKIVNRYRKQYKTQLNEYLSLIKKDTINDDLIAISFDEIDKCYYYSILNHFLEKDKKFAVGYENNNIYYLANENFGKNVGFLEFETIFDGDEKKILEYLKGRFKEQKINELEMNVIPIKGDDLSVASIKNLELLKPFGLGNKEPLFLLSNINKEILSKSINELHLVGKLNDDIFLAAYEQGNKYETLDDTFSIIIKPNLNYFDEKMSVSCMIVEFLKEEK